MAARQELHSGLSEMATQTQNYKLHKFELKDAPADITAINASMDIIDTQLKSLADGKFDKTGGTISGNLVVNGSTTLKKLTASELDLNGNADVSGTLKVTGATTLTGALAANGGVTTTTLKATGTSTLAAVNATNISASGTIKVTGATTLTGALAANGGLSTTTIKATGTSTLAAVNATNISASGTLNVTGTTTLTGKLTANGGVTTKSLTATSLDLNGNGDVSGSLTVHGDLNAQGSLNVTDITATGTLKVNGATSLTGLLTANGGVTTKKVTATELDLNGNADVSGTLTVHGATTLEAVQAKGNLTVGGLLNVTGMAAFSSSVYAATYGATNGVCWIGNPALTKGTTPETNVYSHVDFYDGESFSSYTANRLGIVQLRASSDGTNRMQLICIKNEKNSDQSASLQVGFTAAGEAVAYAPVTSDSATGDEIAVASFARKYGGANWGVGCGLNTSPIGGANEVFGSSDLNAWDKSGFFSASFTNGQNTPTGSTSMTGILLNVIRRWETGTSGLQISPIGTRFFYRTRTDSSWNQWVELTKRKSFEAFQTGDHAVRNLNASKGTMPSSVAWTRVFFDDNSDDSNTESHLGFVGHRYAPDGSSRTHLSCFKADRSSEEFESIWVGFDSTGNVRTYAPTPVTGSHF